MRFSDEPMTMEMQSTRKRKATTNTAYNDKENQFISTQPASKRTCLTGPTCTFLDTFTAQPEFQSLSEPVSSPARSLHRSPQDNATTTATLGSACDLTLPQQAVLSEHVSSPAQSPSHKSPLEDIAATLGSACDLTLPQ